jgi:hypothetical protein
MPDAFTLKSMRSSNKNYATQRRIGNAASYCPRQASAAIYSVNKAEYFVDNQYNYLQQSGAFLRRLNKYRTKTDLCCALK